MKVAIRCIYRKAVTPSCDIVYMDMETWNRFRFGDSETRRQIALELIGKEDTSRAIKEVAWIPLDNQEKLIIAPPYEPEAPEEKNKPVDLTTSE